MAGQPLATTFRMTPFLRSVQQLLYNVYGPASRNVVIQDRGATVVTNDGATILKNIYSDDRQDQFILSCLKSATAQVAESAGDSTTFAALATLWLLDQCSKHGLTVDDVVRIRSEWEALKPELAKLVVIPKSYREVYSVVRTTAKDDVIAQTVVTVIQQLGKQGSILLDDGKAVETTTAFTEGYKIPCDLSSDHDFMQRLGDTPAVEMLNPVVHFCDEALVDPEKLIEILDASNFRPTLIVAPAITKRIYQVARAVRNQIMCLFVLQPREHIAEDLKAFCSSGIETMVVSPTEIALFAPDVANPKLRSHIVWLASTIPGKTQFEQKTIRQRIASLGAATGTIVLGGQNQIEVTASRVRYEDAIRCANSVINNGMLPGGGWALRRLSFIVEEDYGSLILRDLLRLQYRRVVGVQSLPDSCPHPVLAYSDHGWQLEGRETPGIWDSYDGIVAAMDTAFSVACTVVGAPVLVRDRTRPPG